MTKILNENEIWFIKRTVEHIRRVQDNMIILALNIEKINIDVKWNELIERSMTHDLSKFSDDLVSGFVRLCEFYANKRKGITKENINYKELIKYIETHRKIEKHHPHNKKYLSNLDICEMCCDLVAMSQEFNEKDYTEYFKTKLINEIPLLKKYKDTCIYILELLQNLKQEVKND